MLDTKESMVLFETLLGRRFLWNLMTFVIFQATKPIDHSLDILVLMCV
jgi:hypothetical protein